MARAHKTSDRRNRFILTGGICFGQGVVVGCFLTSHDFDWHGVLIGVAAATTWFIALKTASVDGDRDEA